MTWPPRTIFALALATLLVLLLIAATRDGISVDRPQNRWAAHRDVED